MNCDAMWWLFVVGLVVATSGLSSGSCTRKLVTFNTGLTPKVQHYEERRQALPEVLRESDADVICLQEVWFVEDVDAIVESLRAVFPFTYSKLHNDRGVLQTGAIGKPPCAVLRSFWFIPCMYTCRDAQTTREYLECAIQTCGFMELPQECITCLSMTISFGSALQRCLTAFTGSSNEPGLLLLSKTPLRRANVTRFIPGVQQVLPRSYIEVEVEKVGRIVCGHLTPNLGPVYFEPLLTDKYPSWGSQNLDDVTKLLGAVKYTEKAVIMADLNAGPKIEETNIQGDFKDSYQAMVDASLTCPYIEEDGRCTFCTSNPLVTETANNILDHIMVRGYTWLTAKRIFDSNIADLAFPLSDHYGVEVTLIDD